MKHLTLMLLVLVCVVSACNNNKSKTESVTTEDSAKKEEKLPAQSAQSAQYPTDEMQKKAEELQKLPPVTLEELKAMLPQTLMGAKRANFQATSATGTGLATAEYEMNDSTHIKVNIWDCGGPAGAGFYNMQYLGMMNFQSESDHEYTKTIDFKGVKALEHCENNNNRCTLTYFTGDRFLVVLEGENVHPEGLKQAGGELQLK